MIKKADILLAVCLVVLSACGLFLLGGGSGQKVVIIKQGSTVVYSGPLSQDKTVTVGGDYTNVIEIKGGEVYYSFSDCPNKNCVKMGKIHDFGQIACAPNKTIVMIENAGGGADAIAN